MILQCSEMQTQNGHSNMMKEFTPGIAYTNFVLKKQTKGLNHLEFVPTLMKLLIIESVCYLWMWSISLLPDLIHFVLYQIH